jgi:predicted ATPase
MGENPMQPPPFYVLTGGPGAGKTSVIEALAAGGHATVAESGRQTIRDQVSVGGRALPWVDRALYAEIMLAVDMAAWRAHATVFGPVFFDRGVVDVLGYVRLERLDEPRHLRAAAKAMRYRDPVFAFPPWPEIYRTDAERRQELAVAAETYAMVTATYRGLGYRLVEVPPGPVEARAAFVLAATA